MDILVIAALVFTLGVLTAWTLPRLVCPWREQIALRKLAERIGFRYHGRRALGIPRSGRATGTLHHRECTIETFKQMGVDPYTRIVVSVDNPTACSFDVVQALPPVQREGLGGSPRHTRPSAAPQRGWRARCSRCATWTGARHSSRDRSGRMGITCRSAGIRCAWNIVHAGCALGRSSRTSSATTPCWRRCVRQPVRSNA